MMLDRINAIMEAALPREESSSEQTEEGSASREEGDAKA